MSTRTCLYSRYLVSLLSFRLQAFTHEASQSESIGLTSTLVLQYELAPRVSHHQHWVRRISFRAGTPLMVLQVVGGIPFLRTQYWWNFAMFDTYSFYTLYSHPVHMLNIIGTIKLATALANSMLTNLGLSFIVWLWCFQSRVEAQSPSGL